MCRVSIAKSDEETGNAKILSFDTHIRCHLIFFCCVYCHVTNYTSAVSSTDWMIGTRVLTFISCVIRRARLFYISSMSVFRNFRSSGLFSISPNHMCVFLTQIKAVGYIGSQDNKQYFYVRTRTFYGIIRWTCYLLLQDARCFMFSWFFAIPLDTSPRETLYTYLVYTNTRFPFWICDVKSRGWRELKNGYAGKTVVTAYACANMEHGLLYCSKKQVHGSSQQELLSCWVLLFVLNIIILVQ